MWPKNKYTQMKHSSCLELHVSLQDKGAGWMSFVAMYLIYYPLPLRANSELYNLFNQSGSGAGSGLLPEHVLSWFNKEPAKNWVGFPHPESHHRATSL